MKIDSINFPEEITKELGLNPIKMNKIGKVVLIAGKNGAGKSRLLSLISEKVKLLPEGTEFETIESNYSYYKDEIQNYEKLYAENLQKLKSLHQSETGKKQVIDVNNISINKQLASYRRSFLGASQKKILIDSLKISPYKINGQLIDFVPKYTNLTDSFKITGAESASYADQIFNIGTQSIHNGTIPAIDSILRKWVNINASKEGITISEADIEKINQDYAKLKEYIRLFLNTELERTADGNAQLFGKRIGEAKLSDGQIILLQFCMALFAQGTKLDEVIILMDEPENHLHPAALIDVLDKIIPHVTNGQIWIATHSINVLAHFDPSYIWYIEDGEVSYAGNVPRKVLKGLLGNDEEIDKLSHFLSLPAQMATNNFAFESLFYPQVVLTGPDDPQIGQIHQIIAEMSKEGKQLKMLDFGIGKGRLIATIAENERLKGTEVSSWLDYYGYDKYEDNKQICIDTIKSIYTDDVHRYFNNDIQLISANDVGTFDVIIMCNVFHEIDPSEWVSMFTSVNSIFNLLKDDGFLLVIEDQFLAVGEKAHAKGFLVFDELEFKKLFKIIAGDKYNSTDYRNDGRLKSHHIPKGCLKRIDSASRKEAIKVLNQKSKDEIKKLRATGEISFKAGKAHGFWAQQLANSSLVLDEL